MGFVHEHLFFRMNKKTFFSRNFVKRGDYVVEVSGDLTYETIDVLRNEFALLRMQQTQNKVVIDCTGITMLSSVGLGEFSRLIKWGIDNSCLIKIVCHSNHVVEVLEIAGITDMVPLFPTLEMALNAD